MIYLESVEKQLTHFDLSISPFAYIKKHHRTILAYDTHD